MGDRSDLAATLEAMKGAGWQGAAVPVVGEGCGCG